MPETLAQILGQFKAVWKQITPGQRVVILAVFAGILALLGGVVWYGTRTELVPLSAGLTGEDLKKVQDVLSEKGVEWKVRGDTILVPRSALSSIRMELAMKGVGRSGQGWDLLDKVSITAPRFLFQQKELQARCQVIAESIETIEGVESARVTAVVPKKALFQEDAQESRVKASVTVRTRPGVSLAPYIPAIVNLVSGAIERLEPKNVRVVDARTGKLYTTDGDGGGGLAAGVEKVKTLTEYLERRAQTFLDRALGPGHSAVMVHLDVDMKATEEKIEEKDPDSKVVLHERSSSETSQSAGPAGGPPGVGNAALGGAAGGGGLARASGPTKSQEEKEREYDYKKTTQVIRDPGGKITRMTTSVQVDSDYLKKMALDSLAAGAQGKKKAPDPAQVRKAVQEQVARITQLVKTAVGFDEKRGDQVTVETIPFARTDVEEVSTGGLPLGRMIGYGAQVLGALVVLLFLRGLLRGARKPLLEPVVSSAGREDKSRVDPAVERKRLRREIERTVAEDPGAVGRLLVGWLQEK